MKTPHDTCTVQTGISFKITADVRGSGSISRDGHQIDQQVVKLTRASLVVGATLVHRVGGARYRVDHIQGNSCKVEAGDGTKTTATVRDTIRLFWLVKECPAGTCGSDPQIQSE